MSRRAKQLRRLQLSLTALVMAAGAERASGQSIYLGNVEPVFTAPRLRYIKTDVEAEQSSFNSKKGGSTDTERIYLAQSVGIGWDYFIYHPDLLTFSLLAEPGYNWQQYNYAGSTSRQNSQFLNGNLNATFLQLKPYATTFNYNRSHDQYQYDFFNSTTVDGTSYGANSGYREGAVPFTVSVQHSTRDSSGFSQDSTTEQTTAGLQAQNERHRGDFTSLNYQFSQYDSSSTFASQNFQDASSTHYFTMTDTENFGKGSLGSSLTFNHQENQGDASDDLNTMLDYGYQHTAHLRSFYNYSFALYSSDFSESLNHRIRAGLQHRLYESLASSADVHALTSSSDSSGSTIGQKSIGTSASLDYSKRLGEWGHLSVGENAGYDLTHQNSTGTQQFINNESHTVSLSGIFFLDQPRAISIVSITDSTGTITLVRGAAGDYDVTTTGDPWQIQIHSTGPNHIASGSSVHVNYIVQPNPVGDYTVFSDQFQIRLGFWEQRAGVFARYNFTRSHADSAAFVLDDVSEFQTGGDVAWKGFRAEAIYTDRESSLYSYQSITLSEGYSFRAGAHSTAGIDLRQQRSRYPAAGANTTQDAAYYSYTGRYEWHPVSGFSWSSEAGLEQQRGTGADQDLLAVRSYLNWVIGKLDLRLGYEYQNQQYTAETRERNFVFLRARRNF